MPRRRGYRPAPPPEPDPTHFLICHPLDEWTVRFTHREGRQRIVLTERCPMQHLIVLPLRLLALAESGAWFDCAPEAEIARAALVHQQQRPTMLENTDKPRCMASNADGGQCSRGAVVTPVLPYEYEGVVPTQHVFCKSHNAKRAFSIQRPGVGLDQVNSNPLSEDTLTVLSTISRRLRAIGSDIRAVQEHLFLSTEQAQRLGEAYGDLYDIEAELDAIVSGDRERDARQRRELSNRIQRMVTRIEIIRKVQGVDVHMAFINSGGKKQSEMSVEELKRKVDWLFTNYRDAFPADVREWDWDSSHVTGMEPGGIRVKGPEEPVIEAVEEMSE